MGTSIYDFVDDDSRGVDRYQHWSPKTNRYQQWYNGLMPSATLYHTPAPHISVKQFTNFKLPVFRSRYPFLNRIQLIGKIREAFAREKRKQVNSMKPNKAVAKARRREREISHTTVHQVKLSQIKPVQAARNYSFDYDEGKEQSQVGSVQIPVSTYAKRKTLPLPDKTLQSPARKVSNLEKRKTSPNLDKPSGDTGREAIVDDYWSYKKVEKLQPAAHKVSNLEKRKASSKLDNSSIETGRDANVDDDYSFFKKGDHLSISNRNFIDSSSVNASKSSVDKSRYDVTDWNKVSINTKKNIWNAKPSPIVNLKKTSPITEVRERTTPKKLTKKSVSKSIKLPLRQVRDEVSDEQESWFSEETVDSESDHIRKQSKAFAQSKTPSSARKLLATSHDYTFQDDEVSDESAMSHGNSTISSRNSEKSPSVSTISSKNPKKSPRVSSSKESENDSRYDDTDSLPSKKNIWDVKLSPIGSLKKTSPIKKQLQKHSTPKKSIKSSVSMSIKLPLRQVQSEKMKAPPLKGNDIRETRHRNRQSELLGKHKSKVESVVKKMRKTM